MQAIWKKRIGIYREIKNSLKKDNDKLIFQYKNSKPLKEVLQAMLKYSNNFIANQIFDSLLPLKKIIHRSTLKAQSNPGKIGGKQIGDHSRKDQPSGSIWNI